jgi:hypothetical protein
MLTTLRWGASLELGVKVTMATTLKIYLAPSGQWSGILLQDGDEIGRIAGCPDAAAVESLAYEQGYTIDAIETL